MKTTITINLGGIVFHIDDDAYEMLHTYLIAVEKQFASNEERLEVMSDIEARLSELFTETLNEKRDVIMKDDVSKVIKIMGEPEDFRDEEAQNESYSSGKESKRRRSMSGRNSKKLFRDPDNRVLGGVCSGLSAYFNVDPIVFRIIFIIIALGMGSGLIIYIILWIAIPEASTTAQKLEMRGEPITIENIKRAVREEFENVKKNMKF
ncbi:MAG: PspC domain-containing protein [Bacteroidales bacterium]|jgi:phage shock protein PspC (stress-responsive transcriptional regulator)|nr:PspC domain-containing protein [Bacteroidales bacterium]